MKIALCIVIGILGGIAIGEFCPQLMASGLDSLGADLSSPFSPYRNNLALHYGFFGAALGLVGGIVWVKVGVKKGEK